MDSKRFTLVNQYGWTYTYTVYGDRVVVQRTYKGRLVGWVDIDITQARWQYRLQTRNGFQRF